jgi:hypothetical protein
VIQSGGTHQGYTDESWQLFVPDRKLGTFTLGLKLPTEMESSGACPVSPATAVCLKDDFSTKLDLFTEQDGLTVVATISYPTVLHKAVDTKTYHVTKASVGAPPHGGRGPLLAGTPAAPQQASAPEATASNGTLPVKSEPSRQPTTSGSEATQAGRQSAAPAMAIPDTPSTATAESHAVPSSPDQHRSLPNEVIKAVTEATNDCGSPPQPDFVTPLKIVGLGDPAYVLDYGKACTIRGTLTHWCGSGGCWLSVYATTDGSTYHEVLHTLTRAYHFRNADERTYADLTLSGIGCGKMNAENCPITLQFDGTKFSQQSADPAGKRRVSSTEADSAIAPNSQDEAATQCRQRARDQASGDDQSALRQQIGSILIGDIVSTKVDGADISIRVAGPRPGSGRCTPVSVIRCRLVDGKIKLLSGPTDDGFVPC